MEVFYGDPQVVKCGKNIPLASPTLSSISLTFSAGCRRSNGAGSIMYCLCVSDSYLCAECPATPCASCLLNIMTYWTLVRLLHSYFRGGNESRMCSCAPITGPVLFISISSIQLTMLHLPSHFLLFSLSVLRTSIKWQHPTSETFPKWKMILRNCGLKK